MKLIFSILLSLGLLAQSLTSFVIEVNFYLNQDEIVEEFCENKDEPMKHCNGKCYLGKMLNTDNSADRDAITANQLNLGIAPFVIPAAFNYEFQVENINSTVFYLEIKTGYLHFNKTLRPPII